MSALFFSVGLVSGVAAMVYGSPIFLALSAVSFICFVIATKFEEENGLWVYGVALSSLLLGVFSIPSWPAVRGPLFWFGGIVFFIHLLRIDSYSDKKRK